MKICTKCKVEKAIKKFRKDKSTKDGNSDRCKECYRNYRKTKDGLVTSIYGSQRGNSKTRSHPMPTYSKQELREWLFSQKKFHELYDNWKSSGYGKDLAPSCDRLDDYKGYSLSNLQLMTWQDNFDKGHSDRKNGVNNKVSKIVIQEAKNGTFVNEFWSIMHASRETMINHNGISMCCNNRQKLSGGFKWRFKE